MRQRQRGTYEETMIQPADQLSGFINNHQLQQDPVVRQIHEYDHSVCLGDRPEPGVDVDIAHVRVNPFVQEGGTVELYEESHAHQQEDPIYSWEVLSSRISKAGRRAKYTLVLYADGCASCDCPGWINKRTGKTRGCKHIDAIAMEIKETYRRHLRGEVLEVIEATPVLSAEGKTTATTSHRYCRVVDL